MLLSRIGTRKHGLFREGYRAETAPRRPDLIARPFYACGHCSRGNPRLEQPQGEPAEFRLPGHGVPIYRTTVAFSQMFPTGIFRTCRTITRWPSRTTPTIFPTLH